MLHYFCIQILMSVAQLARAVEYADCSSAEQ